MDSDLESMSREQLLAEARRLRDGIRAHRDISESAPGAGLFRGVNVVAIQVPDVESAKPFYRDVLGLGQPIYDLPEVGWIEFGAGAAGGNVALTTAEADGDPRWNTTVVLNVDDCHAAVAELRARGVDCDDAVVFPGYVTYATLRDPFGNRIQMCSPAAAS